VAPRDPYRYFRVEARELLDGLAQGALELERDGAQKDLVPRLLRYAHTLKGAARVVRHQGLADLAHAAEEELEPLRAGAAELPEGLVSRLLALLDSMTAQLGSLGSPEAEPGPAAVEPKVASKPAAAAREVPHLDTVRLEVAELDGVLGGLREAVGRVGVLKQEASGLERARRLAQDLSTQGAPAQRAQAEELGVWLERFDRRAVATLEQAERELLQTHERAERLRLLPASLLFDFLERVARDAAQAQGKAVRFSGLGGEQRLDAAVLSALQEALQHVVRNAVVHGIEDGPVRSAGGKAVAGEIRVELKRQGSRLLLTCNDDGAGINPRRVRQVAASRGLLPADAPENLSMDQAIAVLLQGGISTAPSVTELAGRGVGLDVLREAVDRLRGQLKIHSLQGQGTAIEIQVSASLLAFDALTVEAGGVALLIPFHAVRQALRLQGADIARSPEGDSILLQERAVPYVGLASLFARQAGADGAAPACVVLQGSSGWAALGVERILGVREAMVLPLPGLAPASPLAAGASLNAAGDPCLVLDPDALILAVGERPGAAVAAPLARPLPLLVIDDSMTTRMLEQSILETAGYAVEVASSAEEGLVKLRAQRFGLILVDVEMPGMDGFEFLEQLRADPVLRETPAIMVTSRDAPQDRRRSQSVGARDYVVKGEFDQTRLLARIRELLA
jgi:two-component system chemotaxis sensor kinase CheA